MQFWMAFDDTIGLHPPWEDWQGIATATNVRCDPLDEATVAASSVDRVRGVGICNEHPMRAFSIHILSSYQGKVTLGSWVAASKGNVGTRLARHWHRHWLTALVPQAGIRAVIHIWCSVMEQRGLREHKSQFCSREGLANHSVLTISMMTSKQVWYRVSGNVKKKLRAICDWMQIRKITRNFSFNQSESGIKDLRLIFLTCIQTQIYETGPISI